MIYTNQLHSKIESLNIPHRTFLLRLKSERRDRGGKHKVNKLTLSNLTVFKPDASRFWIKPLLSPLNRTLEKKHS